MCVFYYDTFDFYINLLYSAFIANLFIFYINYSVL